jgi:phospholipase C
MRISALTPSAALLAVALFLASMASTAAYAQTLPTFNHIVIIVQENRTPDNLEVRLQRRRAIRRIRSSREWISKTAAMTTPAKPCT